MANICQTHTKLQGNQAQAASCYERYFQAESNPPAEILLQAANFQRNTRHYAEAEQRYKQALQADPPLPSDERAAALSSLSEVQRAQLANQVPPPNLTQPTPPPVEKPKGLSSGAKTAIGVAVLAVVLGGTIGIYYYAQKSSTEMKTDFSGIQIQNAY